MRTHPLLPILLGATIAAPCAGCYTTWDVPVKAVDNLQGYRAPKPAVLTHQDGDDVLVDQDTELGFHFGPSTPDLHAKLDAIDIHRAPGEWSLAGIIHGNGEPFRVDLRKVTQVTAKNYSPGKTAAAIVVPMLVVGLAVGISLGIVVATTARED